MEAAIKEPFNRQKQFAAKRQAVILSAGQAFRRRGYHNASMKEIAQSLGLTKPALYYYIKNKEEVLLQCHLMAYDAMDGILNRKRAIDLTALDELEQLFTEFVGMLTDTGVSLLTDVDSLSEANKRNVLARRRKIERRIVGLVKQGQKDGSIREGDPQLHTFFFMGALNWLNAWYDAQGRIKSADIAQHFALQMRSGIAVKR